MNATLRRARTRDVPQMAKLINGYAERGLMLPKSLDQLYRSLRDFVVAEAPDGRIVACGGLLVTWEDLAEIRSLAVEEGYQGSGLGREIVRLLLAEAPELEVSRVFALTYQVDFFLSMGFRVIPKETLPRKIWVDCIDCPKFPQCDETAVLLELATGDSNETPRLRAETVNPLAC